MIADIIVDVPLMQTDQPYSYAIPSEFEGIVEKGMRVHVPFGKGNRLIQGIVVGVSDKKEKTGLKEVVEVLDYRPVLNEEQLALADQMRHTVFAYKISILKAMLPSLLNSSYDKILYPTDQLSETDRLAIFGSKTSLHFSSLDVQEQAKMMRLARSDKLNIEYKASDKKHVKFESWYSISLDKLIAFAPSNRALKQQALKKFLLENTKEGLLKNLRKSFSAPVVKFFIEKGILEIEEREVDRAQDYFNQVIKSHSLELNFQQAQAVEAITKQIGKESHPFLLEGVTGSGKTEVYLQVIEEALKRGKTAIMLVPEISLTPQVTNRFIARFGNQVAILHSGLSEGEKYDQWRKIEQGQAKVVVGARSAIFAPLKNIGAIMIDEEHEASYKQDSSPRYHARDVAILRARYNHAVLVLGSATPSLESRARASRGVYQFLELTQRANPLAKIPPVEVVDFRDYIGQQEASNFTPVLVEAIRERLEKKNKLY
ncbi:Helicase PriA essential for oriC/DnaA-independent DNA replication [Streptococcus sp. DD10]|nr:Helicase PriA essential for oriC/DnaA-independent DNA replication [Streptococcus sp. DD10]